MRKYIRFADDSFKLFDDDLLHLDEIGIQTPISAGFVCMFKGELHCTGESTSLNLKSRKEDSEKLIEWLELK